MQKILKNRNGSISLFVLLSVLFFLVTVTGVAVNAKNKEANIDSQIQKVKLSYEKDVGNEDAVYEEAIKKLLPSREGTRPYFPSKEFHMLPGTDLDTGLVITDATDPADTENPGNEYVWIEVPRTADTYGNSFNLNYNFKEMSNTEKDAAYTAIAGALRTYCTKDASDGELIKIGTSSDSAKTTTMGCTDEWYSGCGITDEPTYTDLYNKMLQSVYENGGFWIGRYEAGAITARGQKTDSLDGVVALSKMNLYPINWITCSQAQELASRIQNINKDKYNSSLMFGIQWDLVLRHLNNKGVEKDKIINDTSTWGNHYNCQFEIKRGKYTKEIPWNEYINYTIGTEDKVTVVNNVSTKIGTTSENKILLTTGASDINCQKNIYDFAGNVFEWTLEKNSNDSRLCTGRGGSCAASGITYPVSYRDSCSIYYYERFFRFPYCNLLKLFYLKE